MRALPWAEVVALFQKAEATLRENERLRAELHALQERFDREWSVDHVQSVEDVDETTLT